MVGGQVRDAYRPKSWLINTFGAVIRTGINVRDVVGFGVAFLSDLRPGRPAMPDAVSQKLSWPSHATGKNLCTGESEILVGAEPYTQVHSTSEPEDFSSRFSSFFFNALLEVAYDT